MIIRCPRLLSLSLLARHQPALGFALGITVLLWAPTVLAVQPDLRPPSVPLVVTDP